MLTWKKINNITDIIQKLKYKTKALPYEHRFLEKGNVEDK